MRLFRESVPPVIEPVASVMPPSKDPPATTVRTVPDCARFVILSEPEVTVTVAAVAAVAMGTGPVNVSATARKRATKRKNGCSGLSSREDAGGAEGFGIFMKIKGERPHLNQEKPYLSLRV